MASSTLLRGPVVVPKKHLAPAPASNSSLRRAPGVVRASPRAAALEQLWENHISTEFSEKSAKAAVETMVPHATVLHVPTLTGGEGTAELERFYATHFIPQMPPDVVITPTCRTINDDTVVDEFIFEFTHTVRMDWMLPKVPPTGKHVRVPFIVVVKFEGDKLKSERIYWDQASVLVQLGLLSPALLPCVLGQEQAGKFTHGDEHPCNQLMQGPAPRPPGAAAAGRQMVTA